MSEDQRDVDTIEETGRDIPIPLDQPHKFRRLGDFDVDFGAVWTASDDPLHEVLVRVLRCAGAVAIWAQARGFLATNAAALFTYAIISVSSVGLK